MREGVWRQFESFRIWGGLFAIAARDLELETGNLLAEASGPMATSVLILHAISSAQSLSPGEHGETTDGAINVGSGRHSDNYSRKVKD